MLFRQLIDRDTSTYTYLLADEQTGDAVLIDPVRNQFERDQALLDELGLTLVYTLDTHLHADHVTSAALFRQAVGSRTVVSRASGASCADWLVEHGDVVRFGGQALEVLATPGHTDGCVTYLDRAGGRAFTGDTLLVRGCGRTDFQNGDAQQLFASIRGRLFTLPDATVVYPGHDYQGRTATTIGEEKAHNPRVGLQRSVDDFVEIMAGLNLAYPRAIDTALPANSVCGLQGPEIRQADVLTDLPRSIAGAPQIAPEWVAEHGELVRVIDVRSSEEFTGPLGHIAEAEFVPLVLLTDVARHWGRNRPIVVVCRSGGRSDRAALALQQLGFTRVASMTGGMMKWNALGLAVEHADKPIVDFSAPLDEARAGGAR